MSTQESSIEAVDAAKVRHWLRRPALSRRAYVGIGIVVFAVSVGLLAPLITTHNPTATNFNDVLQPPSLAHPFGTDELGRDLLSRVIYGIRPSLLVSVASVTMAAIVGVLIGTVAGYTESIFDRSVMRVMDVILAFPPLILSIIIVAVLTPNLVNVIIAIAISLSPQFARISRGNTLSVKHNLYIETAVASGESSASVMFRYIFPNAISPIIVQYTLRLATAILIESSMSFLGIGVQPPTPDWGLMISSSHTYLAASPYLAIFPGIAIILVVLGFNLLGDGLREVIDIRGR